MTFTLKCKVPREITRMKNIREKIWLDVKYWFKKKKEKKEKKKGRHQEDDIPTREYSAGVLDVI